MDDTEVVCNPGGSIFCWIVSVITTMSRWHQKSDWSNLKILMLGYWYCKLTSSGVSFTIYQQFHGDIKGITPTLLQYQNVHWEAFWNQQHYLSPPIQMYTQNCRSLVKVKFKLTETFLVIFLTSAVISKHLLFHENTIL